MSILTRMMAAILANANFLSPAPVMGLHQCPVWCGGLGSRNGGRRPGTGVAHQKRLALKRRNKARK